MNPEAWGIESGYWDTAGQWHELSEETRRALVQAMGAGERTAPPEPPPAWFVRSGEAHRLQGPADLVLEDGTALRADDALPPDLPIGYHELHPRDGGPTTWLVVSPGACHLPDDLRTWGWAVQLYATRSRASWGMGDLADLRRVGEWARSTGAGVLAVNPLHAAAPVEPQQPSPYYPTSRRYRNPLYLRVEEVAGAGEAGADLEELARAGRALDEDRRVDRDRVFRLKSEALGALWGRFDGDPSFDRYRREQGGALRAFAVFCALAEGHGGGWQAWPEELRRHDSEAVQRFADEHADRVGYHEWLQWLLDEQLAKASAPTPVVHDLAIGFDPGGADAWAWQDLLALDARVGAPPDEFNTLGQDWGLPPFVPWKLRGARYAPIIETIRAGVRYAGGLRIDHVMGLFRLFWIPPEGGAKAGGYVRYPAEHLLDIVAVESHRAGAFVVGEDLGTVEPEAREELTRRRVLSYRLLWFEDEPPARFPEQALAAVTTHDLPTVAGVWTGSDVAAQRDLGLQPNEEGMGRMRERLVATGAREGDDVGGAVGAAYAALAEAPSRVVLATLDDALGVEERPNMPGTVDEWPNWSIGLPEPLEDVERDPRVAAVAEVLRRRR